MSKRTKSRNKESRYDIEMGKGEGSPSRLFRKLDHLIREAHKSRIRDNSELSLTGEITGLATKKERLIYGFSIKLEKDVKK